MEVGVFLSGVGTGLVVGGGLVWGFRGWIQRLKNKVAKDAEALYSKFHQDVIDVHASLVSAVDKDEATVKAAVAKAITTLRSHL